MGRPRASTPEQCLRVRALAEEGFSKREIAERVYGERGLYGRVERILKREGTISSGVDRNPKEILARLETLAQELQEADLPDLGELTDLYKRRSLQKRLEETPEKVKASELVALFRLELQLENRRAYERIRRLTVHPTPPA